MRQAANQFTRRWRSPVNVAKDCTGIASQSGWDGDEVFRRPTINTRGIRTDPLEGRRRGTRLHGRPAAIVFHWRLLIDCVSLREQGCGVEGNLLKGSRVSVTRVTSDHAAGPRA